MKDFYVHFCQDDNILRRYDVTIMNNEDTAYIKRLEAYQAVNKANASNPDADVSELIKLALKEFVSKE